MGWLLENNYLLFLAKRNAFDFLGGGLCGVASHPIPCSQGIESDSARRVATQFPGSDPDILNCAC